MKLINKKLLLLTPPYHCGVVEIAGRWVPLYLVYLAGAAKEIGFNVKIFDAMTKFSTYEEIERAVSDYSPDYIGISAITSTINESLKVLKLVKKINPRIITILGGVHPTFMYEEIFSDSANREAVDFIVRGEGEQTLKELLLAVENKKDLSNVKGISYLENDQLIVTQERPVVENIDDLPLAYELLDWNDYKYFITPDSRLGAISTSRGCEKDCTFCSQQKFWQKSWRARSPQSLLREIILLNKQFGVNSILITDEYPTKDRNRWEEFLDLIIKENLKINILMETRADDIVRDKDILHKYRKAGIMHIYVGVEAADQSVLDNEIKKGITLEQAKEALALLCEHGIITETSFILGMPYETPETIEKTLATAKYYNPDLAHFLAICPWPYSDIYESLKDRIEVFDYSKYNLITPVVKPDKMTVERVDDAIIDCYKEFYMSKMKEVMGYEDKFRRDYMLTSFKLMMNSSFLKEKFAKLEKSHQINEMQYKEDMPLDL
jgi:anaerobic magnesium-protoporphyrin IX monomethyl ester cyclase